MIDEEVDGRIELEEENERSHGDVEGFVGFAENYKGGIYRGQLSFEAEAREERENERREENRKQLERCWDEEGVGFGFCRERISQLQCPSSRE